MRRRKLPPSREGGYLSAFLRDVAGDPQEGELDTRAVLRAARVALRVQQAADQGMREVRL